ncbi:MAG: 2-dehydropantoate 2-reductase, partial [Halioglobus sp.]|nr:2-dehydropantoate 2-reductase [Halioglobus sp.]
RAGCGVTLLLRADAQPGPLRIERGAGCTELDLPCSWPGRSGAIDHLLVTTKAYDVYAAVAATAEALAPGAIVVLMVNGMGLAQQLQTDYPDIALFCATTTEGAFRLGPRHIRHAGSGATRVGRQGQATAPAWFGTWSEGIPRCSWDADIDAALWHKLAINAVINPLTALHRCRNGELARRRELREQVEGLCAEVRQVSTAAGYADTAHTIEASVAQVIADTAANRSSMLQDVEAGRATEIDFITGYLLEIAARHGIVAARNQTLLEQVKALGQ